MKFGSSKCHASTKIYGFADEDFTDILACYVEAVSAEDYARQKDTGH